MIVSKCRETSPPRDSGFSFWREGVLARFRKDDYFQVLEKQPGGVGFFSRQKGVLVHFQTRGLFRSAGKKNLKIWVLSARHFEPKFPRLFVFPGRRVLGANPAATTYGIHCEMGLSSRPPRTPESDAESVSAQGRVRECSPPTPFLTDLLRGEGSPETVSPKMHPSSARLPRSP